MPLVSFHATSFQVFFYAMVSFQSSNLMPSLVFRSSHWRCSLKRGIFLWILQDFKNTFFDRTPPDVWCFWVSSGGIERKLVWTGSIVYVTYIIIYYYIEFVWTCSTGNPTEITEQLKRKNWTFFRLVDNSYRY